jgi:rhodanese-related sulfurtransferase
MDAGTPLIVYCQGGARSHIAAALLDQLGFTSVRNLSGGFERYTRERWIAQPA